MANADPSLSVAERVDAACDSFERAWRAGSRPSVDEYVAAAPESDREVLRSALLAVEQELKTGRGAGDTSVSKESVRTGSHHDPVPTVARPADQSASVPRIGRFELRAELGSGAFGRVYRAFDPNLDREVALKVPLPDALRTPADRDRFTREAKAAAGIDHPNVCRIYEVGEHEGQPYIVMALVPGQSLAEALRARKEPLPEKQAAIIVRKLALALFAAHQKGVVHRDLKPANVMFDKERKDLVVMDFGLARRVEPGDVRATQSGVVMGTPAYMSPEQARGAAKDVGPEGDIFSLGIIMYELLTGLRPFAGTAHEVIGQILLLDPEPPSAVRPGINPVLEAACLKALAKDPRERFASMKEFAAAVDGYLRQPGSSTAETAKAVETKPDTDSATDDGLSTNTRKLAEVFDAISEDRKAAKAETAEAVEEAVSRHGTKTRNFVLGLALVLAAIGAVIFFVTRKDNPTVQVNIQQLQTINFSDTTLTFVLDGNPVTAAALKEKIELTLGEHEIVASRDGDEVKRVRFTVGDDAAIKDEKLVMADPVPPGKKPVEPAEDGFVPIFNGKDLTGWEAPSRPESFGVDPDGLLTVKGDTPAGGVHWLYTKKEYTDYVLRLEFKFVHPKPTGTAVAITPRAALEKGATGARSARLRVALRNLGDAPRTGAVMYTINDAVDPNPVVGELATGTWHTLELDVRGPRVKVTINGKLVNDVDLKKIDRTLLAKTEKWAEAEMDRTKGHIGLMSWRNAVKFRNIRVKELTGDAAKPPVGASDGWKGLDHVKTLEHNALVYDAVFLADGTKVVTACRGSDWVGAGLQKWDVATSKREGELAQMLVTKLAARGGQLVLGMEYPGPPAAFGKAEIVVWNSTKWARDTKFSFDGDTSGNFRSLELLPDGKSVLASRSAGDDHATAIFDLSTGEHRLKVKGYASCLANDGKTILVGEGAELKQIEIATKKVSRTLKKHTANIACVACSPDGRFAATCSHAPANEVVIWNLADPNGKPILLPKQKSDTRCLAFSPDGRTLLSGSGEGVLKMWDATDGNEVFSVRADETAVNSVRFSPDGTHAVTAGSDKAAKVWKLTK